MKKVFQVVGKQLTESDFNPGFKINNGDVYAFDDPENELIWIWIGKKSSVEESTVAAWLSNEMDKKREGVPEVLTINQGEEPMAFREQFEINVVEGNTPGFLSQAELDEVEFKLYRVYIEEDTQSFDKAKVKEVPIARSSLNSDDVFVLDSNEAVYCFIGKDGQLEEKMKGQNIMQTIDAERQYMPLQYTIYEGEESPSEKAFYDLLETIEAMSPEERREISVEDQRELEYIPEDAQTAEEHLKETDKQYEDADPSKQPERVIEAGTRAHHDMVKQQGGKIKGLRAVADGLPRSGTVAERIASINQKSEKKETGKEKKKEPEDPKEVVKATTTYDRTRYARDVQTNTGPMYRGDDTDVVARSVIPDDDTSKTDYNYDKEGNCSARENHTVVWKAGRKCAVCKLGPPPCSNYENHDVIFEAGKTCSVCGRSK